VLVRIARLPHAAGVVSPYEAGANRVSAVGTIGFATVEFDQRANELPKAAIDRVINTAEAVRSPTLQILHSQYFRCQHRQRRVGDGLEERSSSPRTEAASRRGAIQAVASGQG
jgi:hypothetical protein